jgi:uncharacterized OB-fold protein
VTNEKPVRELPSPIKMATMPSRLEYVITPGEAPARFLRGILEGRILAERCPRCEKVYMPPRGSCATCAIPTREQVELSAKGTVTTFCVVNLPFYGQAVEIPYVCASVVLDGADLPFFCLLAECPVEDVRMGMRVEAVWCDPADRKPSLENIKYMRPTGEPDAAYESYKEHL